MSSRPSVAAPPKRNLAGNPKQKNGPPQAGGRGDVARQRLAKLRAARNIPAQPADAALQDGQLDLQAFMAAHEFEIKSLEQSMATSKAVSTSRAFQKVPRDLRRRTASHNPKRVPRRLRARARKEMAEDKTPIVEARKRTPRTTRARIRAETAKKLGILAARQRKRKAAKAGSAAQADKSDKKDAIVGRTPRPKIRRNQLNDPPKPAAKFRRRQMNKTWLPTHTWHAKRARMTEPKNPLWRFAIPLTSNEKIYRPTHRCQSEKGSMLWDVSYTSTVGLYGNSAGLKRVLQRIGIADDSCWNNTGRRWRLGSKAWSGMLYRDSRGGERRLMCPSAVWWNPQSAAEAAAEDQGKTQRQVFLRMHPSAFLEVFHELLRLTRMENPRLYIEDLRFEIGSIELTGPASTEALLAILTPHTTKENPLPAHARLFASLKGLTNPAALPAGSLLHFPIQDPRLRYPPRKVPFDDDETQLSLLQTVSDWPADQDLQPSALFDRDSRHRASCLPSQKSINRRRSEAVPGRYLKPSSADPPIPITLLASRPPSSTQSQGLWTLLAPWKCIQPLWYALVHVPLAFGLNPRFGGLDEIRQVAFERGLPWFPGDFPASDAGADWELQQRAIRLREYQRRAKSKRTEWASVDLGAGRKGEVGDGLACDFEFLFGLARTKLVATAVGAPVGDAASNDDAVDVDRAKAQQQPQTIQSSATDAPVGDARKNDATDVDRAEPRQPPQTSQQPSATDASTGDTISDTISNGDNMNVDSAKPQQPPQTEQHSATDAPVDDAMVNDDAMDFDHIKPQQPPQTGHQPSPNSLKNLSFLPRTTFHRILASPAPLPPNALINIRIRLLGRGVATPCARLYRLPDLRAGTLPSPTTAAEVPATDPPSLRAQWLARAEARGDTHPLVPDPADLVGFVTTGSFCLSGGRGAALGCVAAERVLADVRAHGGEGRLCVVRNAGEGIGWVARWEAI